MWNQGRIKVSIVMSFLVVSLVAFILISCENKIRRERVNGSNSPISVGAPNDEKVLNDFGIAEDSTAEIENPALNYGSKSIAFENEDDQGQFPAGIGKRASKSGRIAISNDDQLVILVNPDSNNIAIFNAKTIERTALLETGKEPTAVVIHPDSKTAYISNRAEATVVQVNGIDTSQPTLGARIRVGSEPTGMALSPSGALLFVAEWGQGRISVVDTKTMKIRRRLHAPAQPYSVAVTNNGDRRDGDEVLVITEFFGRPKPGGIGESKDDGRIGQILFYRVGDLTQFNRIFLNPIETGFATELQKAAGQKHFASANQMYSVGIWGEKAYVTSIAASPEIDPVPGSNPTKFFQPFGNVFPVVYVANLNLGLEDRSAAGSGNLSRQILAQFNALGDPANKGISFLGDIDDLEFSPKESLNAKAAVGYVLSRAGDVLQRVTWDSKNNTTQLGFNGEFKQIVLNQPANGKKCLNPLGVAIDLNSSRAFVNCWVSRTLAVIDLKTQEVLVTKEAAAPAKTPQEIAINKGARFFYTGTGRWSKNSVSSCASCHSDGLTDNITWSFNAGPRQSVSLDGSFSKGPEAIQKQRILNWSGIFDELHDFERNTRGIQGGFGALTKAKNGDRQTCGVIANEVSKLGFFAAPGVIVGGLARPFKDVQDQDEEPGSSCPKEEPKDWDAIEAWVKQIRPPHSRHIGIRGLESAARGRELFVQGKCNSCHGGSGWTASRRFWEPSPALNRDLDTLAFLKRANFPQNLDLASTFNTFKTQFSVDTFQLPGKAPAGVKSVACVIRNVGTFGVRNVDGSLNEEATLNLERQINANVTAAGNFGFNIPSLYGLGTGAPFFHHGLAATLDDVLSDPRWETHLRAGNKDFLKDVADEALIQARRDLKRFLLTIDSTTEEVPLPPEADLCPKTCTSKEQCS